MKYRKRTAIIKEPGEMTLEEQILNNLRPRIGRPTRFTLEVLAKLVAASRLVQGHKEIAWAAGVPPSSLTEWKAKYPLLVVRLEEEKSKTKGTLMKLEIQDALNGDKDSRRFLLKHLHSDFTRATSAAHGYVHPSDEPVDPEDGEQPDYTYL